MVLKNYIMSLIAISFLFFSTKIGYSIDQIPHVTREVKSVQKRIYNTSVISILEKEIPITDSVQKISKQIIEQKKNIFLSYSWDREYNTKPMVDDFENFIKKLGITNYYRDTREEEGMGMTTGSDIKNFMKNVIKSDVVVVFLNDAYLKSKNCMYEFLQLWDEENKKISPKLFIVRHPDFKSIFEGPNVSNLYLNYWEENLKNLKKNTKNSSETSMEWNIKEQMFIMKIQKNITDIIQQITGYVQPDYQQVRLKSFEDILKVALLEMKFEPESGVQYNLKSVSSGGYLDGRSKVGVNTLVTHRSPYSDKFLQWDIKRVNGYYALKSISSGGYLDGRHKVDKSIEAYVTNRNPYGDEYLQWDIEKVDGYYALKSISSGGYLDGRHKVDKSIEAYVTNRKPAGDKFLQWDIKKGR